MTVEIEIDDFTPCLRDTASGKLVNTKYEPASLTDRVGLKRRGWLFNWNHKSLQKSEVYKLMTTDSTEIQGLIAIEPNPDNFAYHIQLAESAPHNKGASKRYEGVGGHLFALAAKKSMEAGFGGFLYFEAKNIELVRHYRNKFGAIWMGRPHEYSMIIDEDAAQKLLSSYTLD